MDALLFFGSFIVVIMLCMRSESGRYRAKQPRTFAEAQRKEQRF